LEKPRCCRRARAGPTRYAKLLETLSRQSGVIGAIFLKAQSEIQDPAKLKRLVGLIDGETWLGLAVDVKVAIYEGLLARNAEDVKSGAGQYFTPRALIDAIVEIVDPAPDKTVHDPACGTAGFLLAAWAHMKAKPAAHDKRSIASAASPPGSSESARLTPSLRVLSDHDEQATGALHPFRIKRVYAPAADDDGYRILVDRLWPRGVAKATARIDLWLRDVAPSDDLRRRFHGEPAKWREFVAAYGRELKAAPAAAAAEVLRRHAAEGPVTLLYAARDEVHNNAAALKMLMN
jgi:uncharacterized protein YeaO (DUF488 family)